MKTSALLTTVAVITALSVVSILDHRHINTIANQAQVKSVPTKQVVLHREEVDIRLSVDTTVCNDAFPIKATITNLSRKDLTMDRVEFTTLVTRRAGSWVDSDTRPETFAAYNLNLPVNHSTLRCFVEPHEVLNDIAYGNGDTTLESYLYSAVPTSITYTTVEGK